MGSFNDEYLKLRKKRQEEAEEDNKSSVPYQRPLNNSAAVPGNSYLDKVMTGNVDDIAPLPSKSSKEEKENKLFDKGAFDDGYQFGDITKTILGSVVDVGKNVGQGIIGMGEKIIDGAAILAPYLAKGQYYQNGGGYNIEQDQMFEHQIEASKKPISEFVKKDLYNEEDIANKIVGGLTFGYDYEADSVFGEQMDAYAVAGGEIIGRKLTGPYEMLTMLSMITGSEAENALNSEATYDEAAQSGAISALGELIPEMLFGAISVNGVSLDNALNATVSKKLGQTIANKYVRTAAKMGVDVLGEGGEEILSDFISALGQKLTYADEKEIKELFTVEDAWESFLGGAILGGAASTVNVVKSSAKGVDYATGLTTTEKSVVDKVYQAELEAKAEEKGGKLTNKEKSEIYDKVMNDFEKGYISTDTIEEVLGGEDYTNYQNELKRQQDIDNELNELRNMKSGDMTDIQIERMAELKGMKPNTEMTDALKFSIDEKIRSSIQGTRLTESYNEKARRGQAFEADLSQYDSKQAEVIKKAIDSGILNNTNRTHEFVDMVAKISADKGVLFDFANNEKLKESGFGVNGKFVNGYVTKDGITVNIDSNKALDSIVGHEITHVLEGTELYNALQNTIIEYAKSKGEYQSRFDTLTKLYEGIKDADVNAELTADLVGDYLFSDTDFINHLSVTNRNVFQKIYDEIKYLYKVATAGSKQARELEKVKHTFEKVWRESGKASGDTKYSLSDSDGKKLTKEQSEYFKDSKMRDDNGNLMVMYHGSQNAGFHIFDAKMSDDDTSFFFVDRNDVAASYSGTSETYEAQSVRTAEDVNNFIKSIGTVKVEKTHIEQIPNGFINVHYTTANAPGEWKFIDHVSPMQLTGDETGKKFVENKLNSELAMFSEYEVVEENGKFILLYEGDRVADSDSAAGIYEEFCWYEGVGEGDVNYKVYLNLVNPLVVDAEGRNWNNVTREFSQEIADKYHSLTADERAALVNLASWEELSIFRDEIRQALADTETGAPGTYDVEFAKNVRSAYEKLGGNRANMYDLFTIASDNFSEDSIKEFAVKQYNTRDYAQKAKAEGYDGVIFKNIVDVGGYGNGSEGASTVAIAFESNQIKSVANDKPTVDKDIRYSLSDPQTDKDYLSAVERGDTDTLAKMVEDAAEQSFPNSKVRDDNGNLRLVYHGRVSDFNVFDRTFSNIEGDFGKGFYFTSNEYDVDANYANEEGPDLKNKIARYTDFLEYQDGYEELTYEEREQIARDKFITSEPNTITAYLNMENPVYITPNEKGTFLDFNEEYDEEFDEYGEPEGLLVDFIEALTDNAANFDTFSRDVDFNFLYEHAYDGGMYAADAVKAIKDNIFADEIADENGDGAINEVIRLAFEDIGFDGIIDSSVYYKFGNMDGMDSGTTHYIVFNSNQIKSADLTTYDDNGNVIPLSQRFNAESNDIRYSLTEYTAEEKKAHNDMVLNHFGKTYKWAETGYLLLDGTRLDLSGKHDGAPGGYRTVDHRDITEALGYDYGGGDYSGSLIQFMSEGNIRIIPESNGINLSVKPTKAQEQALADFISRYRGEMMLDIDDLNGNTVVSVEYPKGTYYVKILNDIREWFENGKKPEVASRYPFFSLSETNEAPSKYGRFYGKDMKLPGTEDIAPVAENISPEKVDTNWDETPDGYAPIVNSYTIEQELDEIQTQIDALVEEGTALYNNGEEAKAMELMEKINELSNKARTLTEQRDTLKAQEEAEQKAYMDSITDADMPMEAERAYSEADTTPLDEKTLKKLTKGVRDALYCTPKESKQIREIIENYVKSGQSKSELFNVLKKNFRDIYEYHRYSEIAEAQKWLKKLKITTSKTIKGDIADFNDFKKEHGLRDARNGTPVDIAYEELSGLFPDVFPSYITNPTDQYERIGEVMTMPAREWVKVAELSDSQIMQAVDLIHNEVIGYRNNEARKVAEANARTYIDDVAPSRAKEITENSLGDTAPRYQEINSRLEQDKATLTEEFKQKKAQMQRDLADKNTFISKKAKELYNEIRSLKKGVRASKELGYILDHGYEWKSIKTALINAMNSPGKIINPNSPAESVVRELLKEVYESSMYDLAEMDSEYQKQVAKLEAKAEKERSGVSIKTVKERIAEKLSNVEKELADNKRLRADSIVDFNREIARLQEEYNAKDNKNTKVANDILRRIESLQRMKNNVDADYEKRISDLETKKAKLSQEGRTGTSATEQSIMRAELHLSKIDNIRAKFAEKGLDFDETLKKAKNLSTFSTVDNTPQRVMEKSLGYREGQILADETVNKVAQNETEGIKWLNSYTDRKNGLIAQISRQYNIKPGSKESAAAQMYAEGFYVNKDNEIIKYGDNELNMDFPDAKVRDNIKGLARDTRIRQIYDETLDMINESRARNAYPEIQKLDNYFLHFRAMDDTFSRIGLPFNPNDIRAKDLPTDLNGVTADLKPGQPYFASAKHREGIKTSYDLLGGLERYLSSAKNQIYHIDDIQTLRALRNHIADTYGQAKGLEDLDSLSEAEAQERIKEVFDGHLSTFAKFLHEEANVIAGKTALIDRGLEGVIGRRGMTFMNTLNQQVGANMVGFNVSSSLTNFLAPVQAFAKTNKAAFIKGFAQTVSNKLGSIAGKTDGFAEKSPVVIRRKGAERFYRTPFQKVGDAGYVLMSAVDNISTEIIARAKYNELTAKGMSEDQAHVETDKWVSRLMGDRSLGQMPQLYNSKTLGIITKFQLEVRNQLDSQFYDTIQETKAENADIENALKRNSKTAAKVALVFTELAIAQHLFGKAFESVAGYNPAFDIIDVLIKTLGFDDDEESEDTALDNIEQGFLALLEDLPYTSTLTGGRIPLSSALPITELIKGEDEYGNEKSRLETLGEIAPYYILPGGYGQAKKTIQGLGMFSDEHPIAGSYTDSGKLRFPVDETPLNVAQAAIFGQYASGNARDYFDNDIAPLNEKQIQEFIDVGMTIQDYWKYREGLSKYKTLAEKADYIYGLDLTDEQKNVLINNIADRKEDIDMSDYGNYGSFAEFDFANKYPEKYEFWKQNGISYDDYASADEDTKAAYNWAFNNPEKFTLSKAVASNVVTYRQYTKELYDIKADKDEDGKSITGSRKEKVIDYINNLDADYGAKIILFKSEYPADDTYNYDIIDYLNNRDDISYEQMKTILIELGFTVDSQGNITWD